MRRSTNIEHDAIRVYTNDLLKAFDYDRVKLNTDSELIA